MQNVSKWTRWVLAVALVGGSLGFAAPSEAAFKRLFVYLNRTGPDGCATDASGNPYFANAIGYDSGLGQVCQTGTSGSTAQSWCSNSAVWHKVQVQKLQSNGLMYNLKSSGLQKTWTNSVNTGNYSLPSHSTCPSGNTASGTSWGNSY